MKKYTDEEIKASIQKSVDVVYSTMKVMEDDEALCKEFLKEFLYDNLKSTMEDLDKLEEAMVEIAKLVDPKNVEKAKIIITNCLVSMMKNK
jgi:hypothetical protein